MEQNQVNGGNSVGRNMFYVIVAVLAIVFVVYLATNGQENSDNKNQNTQNTEEDQNQNGEIVTENQNDGTVNGGSFQSDVTATGTLMRSDDLSRGNLMLDSNRGKIYIATARDFGSLVNKQVTLNASGSINKFVFLGFNEGSGNFIDTTARGGAAEDESARNVSFTGTLNHSDNADKGNYMISSANGKIYLQSVHDHSAKVGQTVTLSAQGSLNSFTNAIIN
jgi:hypothetical protein